MPPTQLKCPPTQPACSVITYLCAKCVEEIFISLLLTLAFSAIIFYTVALQGSWLFFWLVYFVTLSTGVGEAGFCIPPAWVPCILPCSHKALTQHPGHDENDLSTVLRPDID